MHRLSAVWGPARIQTRSIGAKCLRVVVQGHFERGHPWLTSHLRTLHGWRQGGADSLLGGFARPVGQHACSGHLTSVDMPSSACTSTHKWVATGRSWNISNVLPRSEITSAMELGCLREKSCSSLPSNPLLAAAVRHNCRLRAPHSRTTLRCARCTFPTQWKLHEARVYTASSCKKCARKSQQASIRGKSGWRAQSKCGWHAQSRYAVLNRDKDKVLCFLSRSASSRCRQSRKAGAGSLTTAHGTVMR